MNNFLFNAMKNSMGLFSTRTTSCLIIALFIFNFCQNSAAQQQRLGLAHSNYGGVTNLMSNPADIANGRYRTYIGVGQVDLHFTNNYFKIRNYNFTNLGGNSDTLALTNKKGDYLSTGFDLAGLSWIQSINSKMTFGLSSRARGTFQAVGVTSSFYNTLGSNTDTVRDIKGAGFNIGGQVFSEIDASFAYNIVENNDYSLKVGATVKSLTGALAGGFSLSQFDATRTKTLSDVDKYKVNNGLISIAYFGVDSLNSNTSTNFAPSDIFGGSGKGLGFDIGATYEHRVGSFNNSDGSTPYLFRVGASLTDLGSIKYSGKGIRYYTANLTNLNINTSDSTFTGDSDDVLKALKINKDSFATSFKAQIPTMLRINADVRLAEHFYVNAYLAQSLANRYQIGTQYASFIALTPRFESRYFDFSLPLALTNNFKTFGMGFGMRLGLVALGMDNFTGFLGNPSGLNAHAGLNIGIGRKKNAQAIAEKEKEKEKEAEVVEAKNEAKEKSKKKSKKAPKDDDMKAPEVVAAPKPVKTPEVKPMDVPEQEVVVAKPSVPKMEEKTNQAPAKSAKEGPLSITPQKAPSTASTAVVAPKPTAPKMDDNKPKAPEKVPNLLENAPKSTAPSAATKPQLTPAKAPASVNVAPKPTVQTPTTKVPETPAKSTKEGPLSITPQKAPSAAVVAPKPTVPVVVEKPKTVTLSPIGSGKMGECIEFFPNKAAITGNSSVCLREISKFLMSNKNVKLNVAASVLPTEKVADAMALKAERAKTIRNFLIQSGVEASRIAIKMSDAASDAPIILTVQ
jgi:outer membrane protein OmpA-like peptidoglycan-associated protein